MLKPLPRTGAESGHEEAISSLVVPALAAAAFPAGAGQGSGWQGATALQAMGSLAAASAPARVAVLQCLSSGCGSSGPSGLNPN